MTGWAVRPLNDQLIYVNVPLPETGYLLTRSEALDLMVQLWLAGHFSENEVHTKLDLLEGKTHG